MCIRDSFYILYDDDDGNKVINVKEDLTSFDSVFNIPLFFINKDNNKYVFSKDDIKKVSN